MKNGKEVSPHVVALVEHYKDSNVTAEDLVMMYRMARLAPHLGIELDDFIKVWFEHRDDAMITRQTVVNYLQGTEPPVGVWSSLIHVLGRVRHYLGKEPVVIPEGFYFGHNGRYEARKPQPTRPRRGPGA